MWMAICAHGALSTHHLHLDARLQSVLRLLLFTARCALLLPSSGIHALRCEPRVSNLTAP